MPPISDVTIRLASAQDETILTALATRLTGFALPPWRTPVEMASADARAMIQAVEAGRSDNEVFLAERDGQVTGCLHMLVVTDFFGLQHAHVSVLATTAAAEGSGVGRVLIERAEDWTRRRGLTLLTLNVFAANTRARRFYERSGFDPEVVKYAKAL